MLYSLISCGLLMENVSWGIALAFHNIVRFHFYAELDTGYLSSTDHGHCFFADPTSCAVSNGRCQILENSLRINLSLCPRLRNFCHPCCIVTLRMKMHSETEREGKWDLYNPPTSSFSKRQDMKPLSGDRFRTLKKKWIFPNCLQGRVMFFLFPSSPLCFSYI